MSVRDSNSEADRVAKLPHHFALRYGYVDGTSSDPCATPRATPRATRSTRTNSKKDGRDGGIDVTPSTKSRKRIKRTRDDPSGSIYSHLSGLPDILAPRLDILFCGINPGVQSATSGHHFAHRSNHFYPALHLSGITLDRMTPDQDTRFPTLQPLSLGLTNLAGRPTAEGSELMPSELVDGVPALLHKIVQWKPKTVCFVGKGIAQAFLKGLRQIRAPKSDPDQPSSIPIPNTVLQSAAAPSAPSAPSKRYSKGNSKDDSGYGAMPVCVPHDDSDSATLFFICPSTSARVTTHFLDDKARVLTSLCILAHHLRQPSNHAQLVPLHLEIVHPSRLQK